MPVTVTTTVPADAKVQESVDVPEPPVTVLGFRVHAELSDTRATSAVNPFTGEIATVEVPGEPTTTVTVAGVNVQAKLSEVKATPPVNPFRAAILIVEVPGDPTDVVTVVGLADMVKSGRPDTV